MRRQCSGCTAFLQWHVMILLRSVPDDRLFRHELVHFPRELYQVQATAARVCLIRLVNIAFVRVRHTSAEKTQSGGGFVGDLRRCVHMYLCFIDCC